MTIYFVCGLGIIILNDPSDGKIVIHVNVTCDLYATSVMFDFVIS